MQLKTNLLWLSLLGCGFADTPSNLAVTPSDQSEQSSPSDMQSKMRFSSRILTGIEAYTFNIFGLHGHFNTASVNLTATGPTVAFSQDISYCGVGFFDISAKRVFGLSEHFDTILDYSDSAAGESCIMVTRSAIWQFGARLGGDFPFNTLAVPMRLRPYIGFTLSQCHSKVIVPTTEHKGYGFDLFKLSFYRPLIGFDWMIEGTCSYLKFGFDYEFPWASFEIASPADGDSFLNIAGTKNKLRSSRFGVLTKLEAGVNVNSSIRLFGLAQFYSIFARGQALDDTFHMGKFQVSNARVQSFSGTFGFDFTY